MNAVGAFGHMQVVCMLGCKIRCSSNIVFLIAFVDPSIQCLSKWWWWWSVQNIFFCVSLLNQALLQERERREEGSPKMSDSHLSSRFPLLSPQVVQLTWLSKLGRRMERISAFLQWQDEKNGCWILIKVSLWAHTAWPSMSAMGKRKWGNLSCANKWHNISVTTHRSDCPVRLSAGCHFV